MKYIKLLSNLLIGFFVLLAVPVYSQMPSCLQNQSHPNYHTIDQNVGTVTIVREYILYIPEYYDVANASPLVINMHGFGDCAVDYSETIGEFYGFNDLADQENYIVAYPQGAWRPEKEDHYWEPGDPGIDNIYENDVYFIEQLIEDISNTYIIDVDKIFACGYSNGGMMTYSLACNRSSLFAAVGIMSGAMLDGECMLDNPIPVIKFHGIGDYVLPYDGDQWYASVEETINLWLDFNNMTATSLVSSDLNDGDVVKNEYTGNSCVTLYTINEEYDNPGGHVWFSEDIDGKSPSKIMWDFFNESCGEVISYYDYESLSVKVQPNPFVNRIIINSNTSRTETYSIYNLKGQKIISGPINAFPYTLQLTDLQSNVYLINVGGNVQKIIKQSK